MEQFFVLKKYRRPAMAWRWPGMCSSAIPGRGRSADARQRGGTPVRRRVVASVTQGEFVELEVTQGWWQGTVQQFTVAPTS